MLIGYFNKYREYIGTIEYDIIERNHYGEVLNINDKRNLIHYKANNILELEKNFHEKVDDYIELCQRHNLNQN